MSDTATSIPQKRIHEIVRRSEETTTFSTASGESTFALLGETSFATFGATARAPIDIDRLYEAAPGSTSQMIRALELLKQVIHFLSEAKKSENVMDIDRHVQSVQLTLPKLFACRSIGDGFGVIINSLHFAFLNLQGMLLSSDQLNVVWRILRELRVRPVMSLEQGVLLTEELEACGLEIDAPDLGNLIDSPEEAG